MTYNLVSADAPVSSLANQLYTKFGTMLFAKFVGDPKAADEQFGEGTFLDWARHNKRSWMHNRFRVRPLLRAFADKTLGEITPGATKLLRA